ncbi:MAG: FG-GAP-like repeat-containing protein [Pyrinomonadaceae bacterium]
MRRFVFLITVAAFFFSCLVIFDVSAQKGGGALLPPTLGTYSNQTIFEGDNATYSPSAAPTGAAQFTARTSNEFQGLVAVDPNTGDVRVTNAGPAGTYTIDLTATAADTTTSTTSFTLTVITEQGCGPFTSANLTGTFSGTTGSGTTPQFGSVADFNNDGNQDFAVGVFTGDKVSVFIGNGAGGFAAALDLPAPTGASTQFTAVGDFNGDGNADIAASNVNNASLSIWLGNGDGTFGTRADRASNAVPRNLVVGDFNNDGKQDLAVISSSATVNGIGIHLGNGDGTFGAATTVAIGGTGFALVVGEFTGDTNEDLFTGVGTSGRLLTGDGSGGFTVTTVGTFASNTEWASTGDFNGDDKLDIAIDNISGTNNMNILLGDGMGGFADASGSPFTIVGTGLFGNGVGDLDGDGNLDLFASNLTAGSVTVLRGDGAGGFTSVGTLTGFTGPRGLGITDLNNDGRMDLVIVDRSGSDVETRLGGCDVDITTSSLPDGNQGSPYMASVAASGGTMPYTFGGSGLPANLMVDSGGNITGTPMASGTFYPKFTVTDSTPIVSPGGLTSKGIAPEVAVNSFRVIPLTINGAPMMVSVSGRVTNTQGGGAAGAVVTMTDSGMNVRAARVNPFGYYRFDGVDTGQTYTFAVSSKLFTYTPQMVMVSGEITNLNFTPAP